MSTGAQTTTEPDVTTFPVVDQVTREGATVPHSRTVREAFISTLGARPGGPTVQTLHADGLLDPTQDEVKAQRGQMGDEPEALIRDWIADMESGLDEMEAGLAQMIADDECSDASVLAIAINSRSSESPATAADAEMGIVWHKLLDVREARAAIDFAHAQLATASSTTTTTTQGRDYDARQTR